YNGADSFKFVVIDRGDPDNCSTAPCSAALASAERTVLITVNPVNDAPLTGASPASLTLNEDGSATTSVSGSDVETTAANLTFKITAIPAHGSLQNGATVLAVN